MLDAINLTKTQCYNIKIDIEKKKNTKFIKGINDVTNICQTFCQKNPARVASYMRK